jgi:hypothetical protein
MPGASRIGRALAAVPRASQRRKVELAAEVIEVPVETSRARSVPETCAAQPPVTVNEHIARTGARRNGRHNRRRNHYRRRNAYAHAEPNARSSEHRAARQKQTRQNFRFHFLILLNYAFHEGKRIAKSKYMSFE